MAVDLAVPDGGTVSGHGQARSPLLVAHIEEPCPSVGQVVGIDGEIAAARRPCEVGGQISGRLPHARRTSGHKTPAVEAIAPGHLHLQGVGHPVAVLHTILLVLQAPFDLWPEAIESLLGANQIDHCQVCNDILRGPVPTE